MESSVKAAMLKSSKTIANTQQPQTTRGRALRKAHSIESLESPKPSKKSIQYDNLYHKTAGRSTVDSLADSVLARPETRSRGKSIDVARPKSRAGNKSSDEGSKAKDKKAGGSLTPSAFCTILDATPCATLEVEIVKKLRLHLRNEPTRYIHTLRQRATIRQLIPLFQLDRRVPSGRRLRLSPQPLERVVTSRVARGTTRR